MLCAILGLQSLEEDIGPVAWEHALRRVHSSSICVRHGVLQCKVSHWVHWSISKLARIYPDIDPNCDECRQRPANLGHMFWSCPTPCSFLWLASLTPSQLSHLPTSNPHHYSPCLVSFPLASHCRPTLLSLLPFSHCWQDMQFCCVEKALFPPTHSQWIKDALHFMRLEKIKHTP